MPSGAATAATILRPVTTRGAARADAIARLRSSSPTAPLDADLLLAHACRVTKESLYAHLDVHLDAQEQRRYQDLVDRRAAGEPVAYLRGWKEFFGLRFAVDRRVLIPRPETEVLVEAALDLLRGSGRSRIADVGTGSGAVAVAIAVSDPRARVIAVELSAAALEVARENVRAHGVEARVDLRAGDLLDPVDEQVDVVTANLPYLLPDALEHLSAERTSLLFEPREAVLAPGSDGLALIRRCIGQLPAKLAPGGAALFECDPPQTPSIETALRDTIGATTRVLADLAGLPRVVEGKRPERGPGYAGSERGQRVIERSEHPRQRMKEGERPG
jgi:release factor glutamine methyltransferase